MEERKRQVNFVQDSICRCYRLCSSFIVENCNHFDTRWKMVISRFTTSVVVLEGGVAGMSWRCVTSAEALKVASQVALER
eukprot:6079054-Ditylum_brightwellii.AAC.2